MTNVYTIGYCRASCDYVRILVLNLQAFDRNDNFIKRIIDH